MTEEKFIELVKNKANQNVQKKIKAFRTAIKDAFFDLTKGRNVYKAASDRPNKANWEILKVCQFAENIYVTNLFGNTVSVINATTNNVVTTINVGNNPGGIAAYQGHIYVAKELVMLINLGQPKCSLPSPSKILM